MEQLEQPGRLALPVPLGHPVLLETRDKLVLRGPLDRLAPQEEQDSRDQQDPKELRVRMVCWVQLDHQDQLDLLVELDLQERPVFLDNRVQ